MEFEYLFCIQLLRNNHTVTMYKSLLKGDWFAFIWLIRSELTLWITFIIYVYCIPIFTTANNTKQTEKNGVKQTLELIVYSKSTLIKNI